MTSSELLRFFHTEAAEYLDAIEQLAGDPAIAPDAGAFVAAARALRGSATMARVAKVADIALVCERIANGLRDGEVQWTAPLRDELRAAIAEMRGLVRAAPTWSAAEEERAAQWQQRLRRFAPAESARPTPATPAATTAPVFIALQSSAIAGDLETFVANSANRGLVDDVVNRLRSLRGLAGIVDHPPLSDVADAIERALRELAPDALPSETDLELLAAAASVFRRASSDLRVRGRFDRACAEVERFGRAATARPVITGPDRVVRVDELFYSDSGPHVLQRADVPHARRDQRFRDEGISQAEHLLRLTADARRAADVFSRERAQRDLRDHLASIEVFARSFGAEQVAAFFRDLMGRGTLMDPATLETLGHGAKVLATPGLSVDDMERRLALLERAESHTPPAGASATIGTAAPRPAGGNGVKGDSLRDLLQRGLESLHALDDRPLSEPARVEEDDVVPVESLLFRGRAALARAIELRDAMRAAGRVDPASLQELYDLLDLARAE